MAHRPATSLYRSRYGFLMRGRRDRFGGISLGTGLGAELDAVGHDLCF
jgi:hypothetical protein